MILCKASCAGPAAVPAATLALSGCGGGGSTTKTTTQQPAPDADPPTLAETIAFLTAAETAINDSDENKVTAAAALANAKKARESLLRDKGYGSAFSARFTSLNNSLTSKRKTRAQTLLTTAKTAIDGVTNDSDEETITAAAAALEKAKAAFDNLPEADQDSLQQKPRPLETSLTSKRKTRVIYLLVKADTAVDAIGKYNMDAVTAAATALEKAQTAFDDLSDEDKEDLSTCLTRVQERLNTKEMAQRKSRGEALYAALEGPNNDGSQNALNNVDKDTYINATGRLVTDIAPGSGSLPDTTDPIDDDGTINVDSGKGKPVAGLGKWGGMHYSKDRGTGTAKTTYEVRMYSSRMDKLVSASDWFVVAANRSSVSAGEYTAATRTLSLGSGTNANVKIQSPDFLGAGEQTFGTAEAGAEQVRLPGTFKDVSGVYVCTPGTSTNNCKVTAKTDGLELNAAWEFIHDEDASVPTLSNRDDYLYFGWWSYTDGDGKTTASSAFFGGTHDGSTNSKPGVAVPAALEGKATYTGKAAGLYAIKDLIHGTEGGKFTADAEIMVNFRGSTTNATATGTIDGFRLNGGSEDPGWSVTLGAPRGAGSGGMVIFPSTGFVGSGGNSNATIRSINDAKAPASGNWVGKMFAVDDERNTNLPDTVLGKFYSELGTTHRMVGAFGVELGGQDAGDE